MVVTKDLCLLFVVGLLLDMTPCVSSVDSSLNSSYEAFIGVLSNDSSLLIQPPQGGFVSIVNFTELSSALVRVTGTEVKLNSTQSDLSSALVRVTSTEVKLNSTQSDLSSALVRVTSTEGKLNSTQSDLSSTKSELSAALARVNRTEELLSSVLNRISTLESSTLTAQSPCKK